MLKAIVCWVIVSTGREMCTDPMPLPVAEVMYSDMVLASAMGKAPFTSLTITREGTVAYQDVMRRLAP